MKIHKVGDKGKALCEECKSLVETTYQIRNLPIRGSKNKVKGALAIVCDHCDTVCGFPHQSLARVQEAVKREKESIDGRVPVQVEDILNLACEKLNVATDFKGPLIRFYAKKMAESKIQKGEATALLSNEITSGKSTYRISVKGTQIKSHFKAIEQSAHLGSDADVVKAIAVKIKHDVLDDGNKQIFDELKDIAAVI